MRSFLCCRSLLVLACLLATAPTAAWAQPPGFGGGRGGGRFGGFGDPNSFLSAIRSDEEFKNKLQLTPEQEAELNGVRDEIRQWFGEAFRNGTPVSDEERTRKFAEFDERGLSILNDTQRQVWQTHKASLQTAQGATENPASPTSSVTVISNAPEAPQRRMSIPNETAPAGESPTVSFGTATGQSTANAGETEPRMSFNFRYAPWNDVLKLFAEIAGLTLDLNDTPTGTFNYYDDRSYSVTEALDVLNGYLLPKGYILVRRDRFLVCLNIDDGIPPNMIPTIAAEELPHRGRHEMVSVVIPLDGIKASDVTAEVQQLLGPQGKIAALNNTNSLVVQDIAGNILRVLDLLKTSASAFRGDTAFKSIPLKHISAADAERMIRRLFGLNPMTSISSAQPTDNSPQFGGFGGGFGGGGFGGGFGPPGFGGFDRSGRGDRGGDSRSGSRTTNNPAATTQSRSPYADKIWVTADTRTNHLLVTASPDLMRVVESAVTSLDTGTDSSGKPIDNSSDPLTVKAYTVTGNATQIAQTLSVLMPGLAITDDVNAGRLYIQATSKEHAEIARQLEELSGNGTNSVAVIQLFRQDPVELTGTLRNMFANEGSRAPSIEADAAGRRLLVRGTPEQVTQVKSLLASLGETGENRGNEPSGRGSVRTLPLQGRDPAELLPLLRQAWPSSSPNPIRIVVPSQSSPIRDLRIPSDARLDDPFSPRPSSVLNPASLMPAPARPTTPASPDQSRAATFTPASDVRYRSVALQNEANDPSRDVAFDDAFTDFLETFLEAGTPAIPSPKASATENAPAEADVPVNGEQPAGQESSTGDVASTQASPPQPVGITVVNDELMLTSNDTEALDQMEQMIEQLYALMPTKTRWTVFYLRSADATETAQMLERLFPQSSVTTTTAQSEGILGSLAGGFSSLGRGMMNVTGLNSTLGGQTLRIVTDLRANALFVTGPSNVVTEVEQMLRLLDATEIPTSLRDRIPRSIPVQYADIDEVMAMVESVFSSELTPSEPAAGGRQSGRNSGGGGFNPLAMMMGAAAGGGRPAEVKLTLGIDRQTSHLIVSSNEALYRQIEELVLELDNRARLARPVVKVIPLSSADPAVISTTLSSLIPRVTVSSTRSERRQPGSSNSGQASGGGTGAAPANPANNEAVRQMIEQRMRAQSAGGGNFGGGGFGGRGNSGGGFGGRGFGGGGNGPGGGFQRGQR